MELLILPEFITEVKEALKNGEKKNNFKRRIKLDEEMEIIDEKEEIINQEKSLIPLSLLQKLKKNNLRNKPCPCGSGKKFKNCCKTRLLTTKRN